MEERPDGQQQWSPPRQRVQDGAKQDEEQLTPGRFKLRVHPVDAGYQGHRHSEAVKFGAIPNNRHSGACRNPVTFSDIQ